MKSISFRLLWTLRTQGVPFCLGLAMAASGLYKWSTYVPFPSDSPFAEPLPYALIFASSFFLGCAFAIRAWWKANRE